MAQRTPSERRSAPAHRGAVMQAYLLVMLAAAVIIVLLVVLIGRGMVGLPPLAWPTLAWPTPAPSPTPKIVTGSDVIQQIQQLSRLETTSYSVQTVVTVERPGNVLGVGRQRLLMTVQGTVVAGIDLGRLRAQDVTVSPDGKSARIRLPEAQILSSGLDESKTQVYDFQTGLFTRPDPALIVEAQRAGATQIVETACRDGIMQRATDDGHRAIRQLTRLMGFERVEFASTPAPACPGSHSTPAVPPPTPKQ